jgi:hypothetical protein
VRLGDVLAQRAELEEGVVYEGDQLVACHARNGAHEDAGCCSGVSGAGSAPAGAGPGAG